MWPTSGALLAVLSDLMDLVRDHDRADSRGARRINRNAVLDVPGSCAARGGLESDP